VLVGGGPFKVVEKVGMRIRLVRGSGRGGCSATRARGMVGRRHGEVMLEAHLVVFCGKRFEGGVQSIEITFFIGTLQPILPIPYKKLRHRRYSGHKQTH